MVTKKGTKTIEGRKVDLYEVAKFQNKKIHAYKGQTSASINLPLKFAGATADLQIVAPKPFVCKSCLDTIGSEKNFSPEEDVCRLCHSRKKEEDQKGY